MKSRSDYPRTVHGLLIQILPIITGRRLERFESKIDRSGGVFACHPWLGNRNGAGYGIVQGAINYRGFTFLAHRVAWAVEHRREPWDEIIRHSCDNPPCCNPRHLLNGDLRDNVLDMMERGRAVFFGGVNRKRGPDHSAAQFSWEQRREAWMLRHVEKWPIDKIAAHIGCARSTLHVWFKQPPEVA